MKGLEQLQKEFERGKHRVARIDKRFSQRSEVSTQTLSLRERKGVFTAN